MAQAASYRAGEVIVRLSSGLGNQLFQLAQAVATAERSDARLSFDTTWFQLVSRIHPVTRELRLDEFSVPLPEAFKGFRRLAVGMLAAFFDKSGKGKALLSTLGKMRVIQEGQEQEKDDVLANTDDNRIYLNGYWQTNHSYMQVRYKLHRDLRPKHRLSIGAETLIAKASSRNTGFVHVRRGDYVHFMGDSGTLPTVYYSRALAHMRSIGKNIVRWFVFSEDKDWSRANLGFLPNSEVIDYQSSNRDIEDLMIMKACSAGIIANSSYSWWGAALGDRPERLIIAPDRYWKHSIDTADNWVLPNWLQVAAWD
jgi:hypothetical protein